MAYSTIRKEVAIVLRTVQGIGRVHDHRRLTTFWADFYKNHTRPTDGRLSNWEVTRNASDEILYAPQTSTGTDAFYEDRHNVLILGHMAVNDEIASDREFNDLVDRIVAAFRAEGIKAAPFNGSVIVPEQLQTPIIGHQMFGGVLVHFAQMSIRMRERVGG